MELRKGGYRTSVSKQNYIWGRRNLVTNGILLLLISQDGRCHSFLKYYKTVAPDSHPNFLLTFILFSVGASGTQDLGVLQSRTEVQCKTGGNKDKAGSALTPR